MTIHNPTNLTRTSDREILITRVFNAPRELVWKAYTTSEHLQKWWSPQGWTLPVCELDFRVGGEWLYCMAGPENMESCGKSVFQEIVEPERFVYTDAFADAEGNVNASMPVTLITNEFTEQNGKTTLNSRALYGKAEDVDMVLKMGMQDGITQTLDKLDDHLATL